MENQSELARQAHQLGRLEVLMDVVYAVVLWRIFMLLPRPTDGDWNWDSMSSFLSSNVEIFVILFLAVVITIIYWIQNNALFGRLERTDNRHTVISILQIFFLLLFLYSIRLGTTFSGSVGARVLESSTAALVGIASVIGWRYAMKNRRLISTDVTEQDAREVLDRILTEPITALVTIPFAFVGPWIWEVAWFSYPLIASVLKRRRKAVE